MHKIKLFSLAMVVAMAGCTQTGPTRPPAQPPVVEAPQATEQDALAQNIKALVATLPDGDVAVVKVANYSNRRIDTQALTERIVSELDKDGREAADLSASADAFDLLSARQAGRQGGHQYLLYGQIRESGDSLRLRVMTLANGIIVWSRDMPVPTP